MNHAIKQFVEQLAKLLPNYQAVPSEVAPDYYYLTTKIIGQPEFEITPALGAGIYITPAQATNTDNGHALGKVSGTLFWVSHYGLLYPEKAAKTMREVIIPSLS